GERPENHPDERGGERDRRQPALEAEAHRQRQQRSADHHAADDEGVAGDQRGQQEGDQAAVVDEGANPHPGPGAHRGGSARPTSERAKARALNGCRSSMPSPTPISLIGLSEACATGTSTPPRAVPSSLVMTMPETPIWLPKMFSWASALRPTVASSTSSVSCGASGSSFFTTRMIFRSSSIRPCLFCSRPAVSISTTS